MIHKFAFFFLSLFSWLNLQGQNSTTNNPPPKKPVDYFNPKWSPDGKSIVFESNMDGKTSIYIMSKDGSNLKKITDTLNDYGQPSWSPDGKSLVYYGSKFPMQLFVYDLQKTSQRQLPTPNMDAYEPSWSANNQVAFDSRAIRTTPNDLSVINTDGTGYKKITDGTYDCAAPQWSPDGKKIVFERSVAIRKPWKEITPEERRAMHDSCEIMVIDGEGTNIQRLTHNHIKDYAPEWSHNGKSVYFISETDSGHVLFNLNLDSHHLQPLLMLKDLGFGYSISPDEKNVVYCRVKEDRYSIRVRDLVRKREVIVIRE